MQNNNYEDNVVVGAVGGVGGGGQPAQMGGQMTGQSGEWLTEHSGQIIGGGQMLVMPGQMGGQTGQSLQYGQQINTDPMFQMDPSGGPNSNTNYGGYGGVYNPDINVNSVNNFNQAGPLNQFPMQSVQSIQSIQQTPILPPPSTTSNNNLPNLPNLTNLHNSYHIDPLSTLTPSTLAMLLLFGSITFATVGMAARSWLMGDYRAILSAICVKAKVERTDFTFRPTDKREGNGDFNYDAATSGGMRSRMSGGRSGGEGTADAVVAGYNDYDSHSLRSSRDSIMGTSIGGSKTAVFLPGGGATSSGSVFSGVDSSWGGQSHVMGNGFGGHGGDDQSRSTAHTTYTSYTSYTAQTAYTAISMGSRFLTRRKIPILPWEPTFISTYVLFHQVTLFGWILFALYLLEKYPPNGGSIGRGVGGGAPSQPDDDQFAFWILMLLLYGYFISWRRNDGRSSEGKATSFNIADGENGNATIKKGAKSRKRTSPIEEHYGQEHGKPNSRPILSTYAKHNPKNKDPISSILPRSDASKGDSTQGSDTSKRLEDILLDEDSDNKSLIDKNAEEELEDDDDEEDLVEQASRIIGFDWMEEGNGKGKEKESLVDVKSQEDVMNRFQTLEWKGFLSVTLLIYQYNYGDVFSKSAGGASEETLGGSSVADNLAQVATTSFLFLTGYHHTFFYYYHPANAQNSKPSSQPSPSRNNGHNNSQSYNSDYSVSSVPAHFNFSRVLNVIVRINLTAIFLCFMFGMSIREYMACPLHTYFFLIVWSTLRFQRDVNYKKYQFRMKMFMLSCFIFIYWDCDFGIGKAIIWPLLTNEASGSASSSSITKLFQQWYYLSYLHHWAAFVGMVFAINQPIVSLQLRKLESLRRGSHYVAKLCIASALGVAVLAWASGPLQMPSLVFHISHPYFGFVPIFCYIYWRNMWSWARERHIGIFTWLGEYSLEIYLLNRHASFVFLSGYPRCNFLVVNIFLLFTSRIIHQLTTIIRRMLFPGGDELKCIQHASAITVGVAFLYVLARALFWASMVTAGTIITIIIICGILLYQTIMDMAWMDFLSTGLKIAKRRTSSDSVIHAKLELDESNVAKISPPLVGTLSVLMIGLIWHIRSFSGGASPICNAFVNDGLWVPVKVCSSAMNGWMHRHHNSLSYGCSEFTTTIQWAWPSDFNRCGFRYRSDNEVQSRFQGKRVILIGDVSIRGLFHSLCRFMGDVNAGSYEGTTPSHSDTTKMFGSTSVEYKWAPLSGDVVQKLRNLNLKNAIPAKPQADLIIAGGGAWDKLHVSVTDEDHQSQREVVAKLALELRSLREMKLPTVWFTPPTINTRALNSEEKRIQMNENSLEGMRRMYAELGVESSVSFVLDGPSFTRGRVTDSFDGVNYPPDVYDAGVQILFNALDWLMDDDDFTPGDSSLAELGSFSNQYLGLMMLCFVLIGLFFYDAYFGFSYFAQIFVRKSTVSPSDLFFEAFEPVHRRLKINPPQETVMGGVTSTIKGGGVDDQEMMDLIGNSQPSLNRRR